MSAEELEILLRRKNVKMQDVAAITNKIANPEHNQGKAVSLALEKFGEKTLGWYTKETSAKFMQSRERAWNLMSAAKRFSEAALDNKYLGIATIYSQDSREDKGHSIAYLRALRESMVEDTGFSEHLIYVVDYDVGTILDAVQKDFPDSKRGFPSDYQYIPSCAYVKVLEWVRDYRDRSPVDSFAAVQVMRAEQAGDRLLLAANLYLSFDGWEFIRNHNEYFTTIAWVMLAKLELIGEGGKDLAELAAMFWGLASEFSLENRGTARNIIKKYLERKGMTIGLETLKLSDDIAEIRGTSTRDGLAVRDSKGNILEERFDSNDTFSEAVRADTKHLAKLYLTWMNEHEVATMEDKDELLKLISEQEAQDPEGYAAHGFEIMLRSRYRYAVA